MTSIAAEQFHREHDPLVHFGLPWTTELPCGADRSKVETASFPQLVTCPECKEFLQLDRSSK